MNLGEMVTAARRRANVPTTDPLWTGDFVKEALNEALASISLEQPWPWLQVRDTVTGGTNPIDLSAFTVAVRDVHSVFVGDDEATPVSDAEIDRWDHVQAVGPVFATWADDLIVKPDPTSADTVAVRYFRDEDIMTEDGNTPLMPAQYHYAIVHRACAIGFESLDDTSSSELHERRALAMITRMEANALRRRRGPHGIRVRADSMI